MLLKERFQLLQPFEKMELALVRVCAQQPSFLSPPDEAMLRHALSLARLYRVRHQGRDMGVGASVKLFRAQVLRLLSPLLLGEQPARAPQLAAIARALREDFLRTRETVFKRLRTRVPADIIDRELRQKSLVLVTGGGGGVAYLYVGTMALLDEHGLRPALIAGASMGAMVSLFRARSAVFDSGEIVNIVRQLSWKKLFRAISVDSRYGIPAALRLFLRAGVGRYFDATPESGHAGMRIRDLKIPTIVTVAGIRKGMLPHPPEFYERLLTFNPRALLQPRALTRALTTAVGALAELFTRPEIMTKLHLGLDADTHEFDAIDAAGFSCALPGVIHYDVLREDTRMHGMLGDLMAQHRLGRLADGGLVDNLPAKAAWRAVHQGKIGTRNAFILGLNGFAPKLSTPHWLPLQRLAAMNVTENLPYAHYVKNFKKTLSPLDVVPSVEQFTGAIGWGKNQFEPEMPWVSRMLAPLPQV